MLFGALVCIRHEMLVCIYRIDLDWFVQLRRARAFKCRERENSVIDTIIKFTTFLMGAIINDFTLYGLNAA